MKKRFLCIVLIISLLLTLVPASVFADGQTDEYITGSYFLEASEVSDVDAFVPYYYSDTFFDYSPKVFNQHLATMSLNLAIAGMYRRESGVFGHSEARRMLAEIGCDEQSIHVNDEALVKPTETSIAYIIGNKKLDSGEILLPISVRGGNYGLEWVSNFTIGETGEAKGFSDSAKKVFTDINEYLEKYNLKGETLKFWVTGYSRGAAVANLTAKYLVDLYGKESVYGYTWETPLAGLESEEISDYSGIHNMINSADLVPKVAPAVYGFKRYGVDHCFVPEDANEYAAAKEKMLAQLATYAPNNTFDDSFEIAYSTIDFFNINILSLLKLLDSENEVFVSANHNHKAGVNKYFSDWLDSLWTLLVQWSITSRKVYVTDYSVNNKAYTSPQDALSYFIGLFNTISNRQKDTLLNGLKSILDTIDLSDISEMLGKIEDIDAWKDDYRAGWGLIPERGVSQSDREALINYLWNMIANTSALSAFSDEQVAEIKTHFPALVNTLAYFLSYDGNTSAKSYGGTYGYGDVDHKFVMLSTLVYNMDMLVQNHDYLVNLAWARSMDSLYENETTSGEEPSVNVIAPKLQVRNDDVNVNLSFENDNYTSVYYKDKLYLDNPELLGELFIYSVYDETTSSFLVKNQLYEGGIVLPETIDGKFTITAQSRYSCESSNQSTYKIVLVNDPMVYTSTDDTFINFIIRNLELSPEQKTSIILGGYAQSQFTKALILSDLTSNSGKFDTGTTIDQSKAFIVDKNFIPIF